MILMVDNYDSFTYNLVQYMGELGAELRVDRNDQITLQEIEALKPQKIVISPGPCTPDKAGISVDVIKYFAGKTPILGVCLGHQSVGQAFGSAEVRRRNDIVCHTARRSAGRRRRGFTGAARTRKCRPQRRHS